VWSVVGAGFFDACAPFDFLGSEHRIASGALVHAKFCTLEKRAVFCEVAE